MRHNQTTRLAISEGMRDWDEISQGRARSRARMARWQEAADLQGITLEQFVTQQRTVRWAKGLAKKRGLAYWPALAFGPRDIDPAAYVAAERVLTRKSGGTWGTRSLTGDFHHGGWDAKGYYGPDADDVARFWRAAGAKDSPKFRLQVQENTLLRKGDSLPFALNFLRGQRWYLTTKTYALVSRKAYAALGRLSPVCRWAALQGIEEIYAARRASATDDGFTYRRYSPIRVRDLNWAEVKRVQGMRNWQKAKLPYLPLRTSWGLIGQEVPAVLRQEDVPACRPHDLPWAQLDRSIPEWRTTSRANFLPMLSLLRFWGSFQAADKYVRGYRPLDWVGTVIHWHDAGQVFQTLPDDLPDLPGWRRLLSLPKPIPGEIHGEALFYASKWGDIYKHLGRVPASLRELRAVAAIIRYTGIETDQDRMVAERAGELNLSQGAFEKYRDLCRREQPSASFLPHVLVTGADVGLEGDWELSLLPKDDPIGPMLGLVTNCCQHLGGAASSCAKAVWLRADCAAYVVRYKGRITAQSFAWRDGDVLCFDSIEALSSAYVEGISRLYQKAAHRIVGRLGIAAVVVGATAYGITHEVTQLISEKKARKHGKCPVSYTDAHEQKVIASAQG